MCIAVLLLFISNDRLLIGEFSFSFFFFLFNGSLYRDSLIFFKEYLYSYHT